MLTAAALLLAGCNTSSTTVAKRDPSLGVTPSPRVIAAGKPIPKGGGVYRVGTAYQVAEKSYTPFSTSGYSAVGTASWYGDQFHGRLTSNGEVYDKNALSAAHPTLPLPSYVRVTNVSNGHSIVVRVNDRGPFSRSRLIDVSARTADLLGFRRSGTAKVQVDYIGVASLQGSDDRKLMATYSEKGPIGPTPQQFRLASLAPPPPPPPPPRFESAPPAPPPPHEAAAPVVETTPAAVAVTAQGGAYPKQYNAAQRIAASWNGMPAAPIPLATSSAPVIPKTALALTPPY
jgi:rare lipoprotein A